MTCQTFSSINSRMQDETLEVLNDKKLPRLEQEAKVFRQPVASRTNTFSQAGCLQCVPMFVFFPFVQPLFFRFQL